MIEKLAGTVTPPFVPVDQQTASDIIRQMQAKHLSCRTDYDKIVGSINMKDDIYSISKELWTFCRKNLSYVIEDGESQYVSSPYTILTGGNVDCKNYALFIAGMLDALKRKGYPLTWCFRYASYSRYKPKPGHVFVVVNPDTDNIWVDPVLDFFDWHMGYYYHRDKRPTEKSSASVGRIFSMGATGSTWRNPVPPANLNLAGPVPAGTTNGYGTATWIPDGYPTKVQPYMYQGRLILRPLAPVTEVNVQQAMPFIEAALQAAIIKYAPVPYSILYVNNLWNAPSVIENQTLSQVNHFAQAGSGIDDWLQVPPQPSTLDKIWEFGATDFVDGVAEAFNLVYPGLGVALLAAIKAATPAGTNNNTQQLQNQVTTLASTAPTSSSFLSNILTGSIIPGVKNIWLIAAFGLLVITDLTD